MENNDKWENTVHLISSLVGDSYVIRRLFITDYGASIIKDNVKEWTNDYGKVLVLGKNEDIGSVPNDISVNLCYLIKIIHLLNKENKSFIIGNNFFYPSGIELDTESRIIVPTSLNNVVYYGNKKDKLGVVTREVYNYVMFNDLDVTREDRDILVKKKKLKNNN